MTKTLADLSDRMRDIDFTMFSTRAADGRIAAQLGATVVRDDRQDLVYKTRNEKINAIVEETERLHQLGA